MRNGYGIKYFFQTLVTYSLFVSSHTVFADEIASVDFIKLSSCVACHGADGMGKAEQYPNLQGQNVAYMVQQLQDFRSGARKDAAMNTMAKLLSDKDMTMLATYFSNAK